MIESAQTPKRSVTDSVKMATPKAQTPARNTSTADGYVQWRKNLKRRTSSMTPGTPSTWNMLSRERPYSLDDFIILKRREKQCCSQLFSKFCLQLLATFQSDISLFMIFEWVPSSLQTLLSLHRVFTTHRAFI
ncbi:hypothetical protein BC829DRAFT_410110 [Chytridium lagenaria]|nr:hypothetical protein BC829DRAFT_410110 [Chytridium lagenaria]